MFYYYSSSSLLKFSDLLHGFSIGNSVSSDVAAVVLDFNLFDSESLILSSVLLNNVESPQSSIVLLKDKPLSWSTLYGDISSLNDVDDINPTSHSPAGMLDRIPQWYC